MLSLKVISLYLDDEVCRDIELSVGRIDGVSIESRKVNNLASQLTAIGDKESADVLFVELDDDLDELQLDDIETELARIADSIAVFVSFATHNITLMRRMIRIGVRDVIPQPLDRNDLANQVSVVVSEKRERLLNTKGSLSSVYAFLNAKGGCGASTLAVNVAVELAQQHKLKVALIDLDLQLATTDLLLDLVPKSTAYDAISQSHRVDSVFLKALMTRHSSGLDVLPSPGGLTSIADVSVEDIRRVLDAAAEAYDVVILDMPLLFTGWTIEALKMSEKILLVVQNSLATIRDAKSILDNLPTLGIERVAIEVVSNRAEASMGSVSIDELKKTLNVRRAHRIRSDFRASANAQNQGKPVPTVAPNSKMTKDIRTLSRYLFLSFKNPGEDPTKHSKLSLWGKLIGQS